MYAQSLPASSWVQCPPASWPSLFAQVYESVHLADRWIPLDTNFPVTIAELRGLHQFASEYPVGSLKVACLPWADQLSPVVANALLKLLEEPPPYLRLMLVSESAALLPTVRSRVQLQRLPHSTSGRGDVSQATEFALWQDVLCSYDAADHSQREVLEGILYRMPLMHGSVQQDTVRRAFSS